MSWVKNIEHTTIPERFTFAPDWYLEAKEKGVSPDQLYQLVHDYCATTLGSGSVPEEALVKLMIATYEA